MASNNIDKGLDFMNGYAMLKRSRDDSLNATTSGSKTPQYVIQCPGTDIFTSDLGKISGKDASSDTAPCLWIETGAARLATYDSSGQLSGDGKVVSCDPIVLMKYGDWAPSIQQLMIEGKKIDQIIIKRVVSIRQTLEVIQEIDYSTCLIKTYKQEGGTIMFSFNYVEVTDLSRVFGHEGDLLGQRGMKFNSSNLKIESISS
ncbi:MAG: hypothetical protein LBQ08_04245 [Holosporaceae bacterium]|jgi:hypothetical protein|nr:hypothetical protein [Holosporaceae bacterium]